MSDGHIETTKVDTSAGSATSVLETLAFQYKRVEELLARCTELENERRSWKHRAEAAHKILTRVLVDAPLAKVLAGLDVTESHINDVHRSGAELLARIDLLEQDAWCGAARVAREFVREMDDGRDGQTLLDVACEYVEEFRAIVGDR